MNKHGSRKADSPSCSPDADEAFYVLAGEFESMLGAEKMKPQLVRAAARFIASRSSVEILEDSSSSHLGLNMKGSFATWLRSSARSENLRKVRAPQPGPRNTAGFFHR
jgi:hypothetical protein